MGHANVLNGINQKNEKLRFGNLTQKQLKRHLTWSTISPQRIKPNSNKNWRCFFISLGPHFPTVSTSCSRRLFRSPILFHIFDNLEVLRPDVKLPSRHKMSSILLEAEYTRQMTEMKETLQNHMVCMTSDGWTNVNSSPILNYLVSFQGHMSFLLFHS